MSTKVVISVISDLVTDQRVHRTSMVLHDLGFEVLLVGRKLRNSVSVENRPYQTHRFTLLFEKGPLFYAGFNIRLFFFLLFRKSGLLISNDLDTLLPNYLVSKIKGLPLVYDSHEYFTGVPELADRKRVRGFWKKMESYIFPHLKEVITVNDSIAELYEKEYGIRPVVVRNISKKPGEIRPKNLRELGLKKDKKILVLQGSGINKDRGAEELVEAMRWIDDAVLMIIGGGDVIDLIKKQVTGLGLQEKVIFLPRMAYSEMMEYTAAADLGLTLDKDTNLNYRFSLPNKLFDYIHAGIPVLASPLPEIKKIITEFEIGDFIPSHHPQDIAKKVNETLGNQLLMQKWKKNTTFAGSLLRWEKESEKLTEIFSKYA